MAIRQTSSAGFPADILLRLDRSRPRTLRRQLEGELRLAIQTGRLPAGTKLPSSRALALDLGIARSVVVEAYGHLTADGYLTARQGSGTQVLAIPRPPQQAASPSEASAPRRVAAPVVFIGGLPDPTLFPRGEWVRHYRAAVSELPDALLRYPGRTAPPHFVPP